MKHLPIVAFLLLCQVCFGQQVEIATSIAPEDLGAYKWILSGTAEENNVVIFRVTTVRDWPDGKVTTEHYDTVRYSPGNKQTGSAFFIDPLYFDSTRSTEPKWHFRALGSTGWIEGEYAGHSYNGDKAEINFKSEKWGKTKKIFETYIKSYDEASLLYGDLPPISPNSGWEWAGSPKKQSAQDAALNADKPRE